MTRGGKPNITSRTSPVMRRIYELLGTDGTWHRHEVIVAEAMKVVPPGEAIRRAERDRQHVRKRQGQPPAPRKRHVDDYDLQVAAGQRAIARQRIWGSAHIEFRLNPETGDKEIRYAPGMGRLTHAGVRTRRMTGISTKHIPYRYRNEETSDQPSGDAREHDAVPGADAAPDPQPEDR